MLKMAHIMQALLLQYTLQYDTTISNNKKRQTEKKKLEKIKTH